VVDLTSVEFLASMGIRSIVFAARAIMSKRGACTLVSPPGDVRTVLTSSGIDEIIPIYDTMDEAILAVTPA
jgi:anti-anti-sigma factor